ncbi:MAG: aldo/keto reductase [Deltaproteobacteria bacterium]|jgi:predicted aldo/keto reductase-like oxidoreductase|nr:aldo/keto reductase [Deltaproteobacteria bacterium]
MINKRSLGQSGEAGSILGFGCMRLPLAGPKSDEIDLDLATHMLRTAIDRGVNYVDTAYPYHSSGDHATPGASEPFVGQALRNGYRDKVLLATKLPTWMVESRAHMHKLLDAQLKRLEVYQIDFYLAHNLNLSVWDKMIALGLREFMDEAVKDGRIRFPSFSFHDSYGLFEKVVSGYDWVMTQLQYNYLDQDYQAGRKGVELAAQKGLAVVVMEPLRGGFLVNQVPEESVRVLKAARPEWSLAAWGLNWIWSRPESSVVLSGMSSMDQVTENLTLAESFTEGLFTEKDEAAVNKVREDFQKRLQVNCTACGYCQPCPSGVEIAKNLGFLNQYYLFDSETLRNTCRFFYAAQIAAGKEAANCVACGECQKKCPQGIDIPKFLARTAEIYQPPKA